LQSEIANPKSGAGVPQEVFHHTFANGLTLLVEPMGHVRSAALNFLVPAGCVYDPPAHLGAGSVLADLMMRGAGTRDSRELTLALDGLGLDHDESVGALHTRFWASTLAKNIPAALAIYADILRKPRLPKPELDPVRALALQDLQSLEDEPKQKVLVELRRRHYPAPLGQDRRGTAAGLRSLTPEVMRKHYQRLFQPRGCILSIAGNVEWPRLRDLVGKLFGDWKPGAEAGFKLGKPLPKREHLAKETEQTQIGIAFESVPFGQPEYYAALGAVNVLSGGMSARLFTEVREKRGLCYAVWATYQTFKDRASILCYAGTTNERAQETLDVTLRELERLQVGIEPDEVTRVQAGLKSSLIMQEESTSARAGTIASDWYYLGRVRSFDEIQSAINSLTPASIIDYLHKYPPGDYTIVTLGPKALTLNGTPITGGNAVRPRKLAGSRN
jgi:predicted Zn-dependent peptidase